LLLLARPPLPDGTVTHFVTFLKRSPLDRLD